MEGMEERIVAGEMGRERRGEEVRGGKDEVSGDVTRLNAMSCKRFYLCIDAALLQPCTPLPPARPPAAACPLDVI